MAHGPRPPQPLPLSGFGPPHGATAARNEPYAGHIPFMACALAFSVGAGSDTSTFFVLGLFAAFHNFGAPAVTIGTLFALVRDRDSNYGIEDIALA